jgi:hypothetical protein
MRNEIPNETKERLFIRLELLSTEMTRTKELKKESDHGKVKSRMTQDDEIFVIKDEVR